jgi:hypothetical protein
MSFTTVSLVLSQANPFEGSSLYDLNTTYVPPDDLIVHEQTPDAVVPAVPEAGAAAAAAPGARVAAAAAANAAATASTAAPLQFTGPLGRDAL